MSFFSAVRGAFYFYLAPGRETGYCFRAICLFVCLFVSLFLCLQLYEKTAGPICMKFSGKVWSDLGTTWLHFGSIRVNGSASQRSICLLSKLLPVELDISFALAWSLGGSTFCPWRLISLISQYHSLSGSRGGVCCAAHHSLFLISVTDCITATLY